jgi:hypothetical protein
MLKPFPASASSLSKISLRSGFGSQLNSSWKGLPEEPVERGSLPHLPHRLGFIPSRTRSYFTFKSSSREGIPPSSLPAPQQPKRCQGRRKLTREPQSNPGASPAKPHAGSRTGQTRVHSLLLRSLTFGTRSDPGPVSTANRPKHNPHPTASHLPRARRDTTILQSGPRHVARLTRGPTCLPLRLHAEILPQFSHRSVADAFLAGRQPLSELEFRRLHGGSHCARSSIPGRAPPLAATAYRRAARAALA